MKRTSSFRLASLVSIAIAVLLTSCQDRSKPAPPPKGSFTPAPTAPSNGPASAPPAGATPGAAPAGIAPATSDDSRRVYDAKGELSIVPPDGWKRIPDGPSSYLMHKAPDGVTTLMVFAADDEGMGPAGFFEAFKQELAKRGRRLKEEGSETIAGIEVPYIVATVPKQSQLQLMYCIPVEGKTHFVSFTAEEAKMPALRETFRASAQTARVGRRAAAPAAPQ